jgi:hypothetical protein
LNPKVKWSEPRYFHWLQFSINNIVDPSTKLTPFEKTFGRTESLVEQLNLSPDDLKSPYILAQQKEMVEIQEIIQQSWKKKYKRVRIGSKI